MAERALGRPGHQGALSHDRGRRHGGQRLGLSNGHWPHRRRRGHGRTGPHGRRPDARSAGPGIRLRAGVGRAVARAHPGVVRAFQTRHARAKPLAGPVSAGQQDHRQSQRHRAGHRNADRAAARGHMPCVRAAGRASRDVRNVPPRRGADRLGLVRQATRHPAPAHQVFRRWRKPCRAHAARSDSPWPAAVGGHHGARSHDHIAHHRRGSHERGMLRGHGAHCGHDPRMLGLTGLWRGGRRVGRRRHPRAGRHEPHVGHDRSRHRGAVGSMAQPGRGRRSALFWGPGGAKPGHAARRAGRPRPAGRSIRPIVARSG